MVAAIDECQALLAEARSTSAPARIQARLAEDRGPLEYAANTLHLYDAQGRAVRSFSSLLPAPSSLMWNGSDDLGQPLPSGAYFVRLNAGSEHATARVVLQR